VTEAEAIAGVPLVVNKFLFSRVPSIESSSQGGDPYCTGVVLVDGRDIVVADTVGVAMIFPVMGNRIGFWVKPDKPFAVSANPEDAGPVLPDAANVVLTQTGAAAGSAFISGEYSFPRIKLLKPFTGGANPEFTGPVLTN
jgi:hypothetical protein